MATHHLSQIIIAQLKAPMDDPMIEDFVADLDRINQPVEHCDGFIWRLQDESGTATSFHPYNDTSWIFNMSVWQ